MKSQDLRSLGKEALEARIAVLQAEYDALAESVRTGKEQNHAQLRAARRVLARARTIATELAST